MIEEFCKDDAILLTPIMLVLPLWRSKFIKLVPGRKNDGHCIKILNISIYLMIILT